MYLYTSIYLHVYLNASISTCISLFMYLYVCIYLYLYVSLCLSMYLYISLFMYLYVYICVSLSIYITLRPSLYLYPGGLHPPAPGRPAGSHRHRQPAPETRGPPQRDHHGELPGRTPSHSPKDCPFRLQAHVSSLYLIFNIDTESTSDK